MARIIKQTQTQKIYDDEDLPPTRRKRRKEPFSIAAAIRRLCACAGMFMVCVLLLPKTGLVHSSSELFGVSLVLSVIGILLLESRLKS